MLGQLKSPELTIISSKRTDRTDSWEGISKKTAVYQWKRLSQKTRIIA